MTRREYVRRVWIPGHAPFLVLACAVIASVTAPDVPGAASQGLAYVGAAVVWCAFLVTLRALTWTPWKEEAETAYADNVVPIRPGPGDAG